MLGNPLNCLERYLTPSKEASQPASKQASRPPNYQVSKRVSNVTFYEAAVCPRMVAYVTNEHLNGFPSEEMNSSFSLILEVATKALFLSAKMKKKPIDISWTSFTPYAL